MTKKIYRGESGAVSVVLPGGRVRPLKHVVLHSPGGFGWGYGGSGAADLALSILADVLGREEALRHYQSFKWEVISRLPFGFGFEISSNAVADWLRQRGVEVP